MVELLLRRVQFKVPEADTPAIDTRSLWIYYILAAEMSAAAILFLALGLRLTLDAALALPGWTVALCAAAMLLRRYGHLRTSAGLEMTALIYGQGIAALFLMFPLTALSAPLADAHLAAIDHALGFSWTGFAALFAGKPAAQYALVLAYNSFRWQPLLIVVLLCCTGRLDRCWRFVAAATVASAITALLYPFVPALGTFYHYRVDPQSFPLIASPWQFGPVIEALKAGLKTISPREFTGLVSFPSYHASAAVLFTWAVWQTRIRLPILLLNVAMTVSALIIGGHYLVDLIGGAAVAVAALRFPSGRTSQSSTQL